MTRITLLFLVCLVSNILEAQNFISHHPVSPNLNFSSENLRLLDGNDANVLMALSPLVESVGAISFDLESEANDALVLCDSQLEPIWSLNATNSRFLSAKLSTDGHVLAVVASTESLSEITLNGDQTFPSGMYVLKLSLSGEIIWSRLLGGGLRQSCTSLEVSPLDQSIYLVSCMINVNFENPTIEFAGEELFSISELIDFPDNVIALKFSALGDELWGRTFQGYYTDVEGTAISSSGILSIGGNGSTNGGVLEFAGSQVDISGSFIISYDSDGNEAWWKYFPAFDELGSSSVKIADMESIDDFVYVMATTDIDSIQFNNELINFDCVGNGFGPSGNWVMKFDSTGQEIEAVGLGCRTFSAKLNIQMQESDGELWVVSNYTENISIMNAVPATLVVSALDLNLNISANHTFISPSYTSFFTVLSSLVTAGNRCFVATRYDEELTSPELSLFPDEDDNTIILEFATSTGVPEISNEELTIYPNPTDHILNIILPENMTKTDIKVEIFDGIGRTVLASQGILEIDLHELSSGQYIIKLLSNKELITSKFIKK